MMKPARLIAALLCALAVCGSACEQIAWRRAQKKGDPEALQKYLDAYPDGEFAQMARNWMDDTAWQRTMNEHTAAALREYLVAFPQGNHADEAGQLIRAMIKGKLDGLSGEELSRARVTFQTDKGDFTLRFFPDRAPGHVRNMLSLAYSGFYHGTAVNRTEPDRIVILGDFGAVGRGGPGYFIPAEFNDLKHQAGRVTMMHLPHDPNTAGSQFGICLADFPKLDGKLTVFAEVESGLEVVSMISRVPNRGPDGQPPMSPLEPVKIIRTEVTGVDLGV